MDTEVTQFIPLAETKRTPTSKICLEDIRHNPNDSTGDLGMIHIASVLERGLSELLSDSPDKPVKTIGVHWINIPDQIENPYGCVGFFELTGRR